MKDFLGNSVKNSGRRTGKINIDQVPLSLSLSLSLPDLVTGAGADWRWKFYFLFSSFSRLLSNYSEEVNKYLVSWRNSAQQEIVSEKPPHNPSHINSQFASNRIIFDSAGFFREAEMVPGEGNIFCSSVGTSLIISWTNHFHHQMRKVKYFLKCIFSVSQSALAPARSESGLLLRRVGQ